MSLLSFLQLWRVEAVVKKVMTTRNKIKNLINLIALDLKGFYEIKRFLFKNIININK